MKIKSEEFTTSEICMKYRCKTCPAYVECEKRLKDTRLMYKPFENIKELYYGRNKTH